MWKSPFWAFSRKKMEFSYRFQDTTDTSTDISEDAQCIYWVLLVSPFPIVYIFIFFWMRDFTLLMTWGCYSHIQWSGTGGNIHWFKWNKSTYTSYKLLSSGWMRVQLCLMDACFYLKSYCVCLTSFPLPDSFSLAQWPTFLWPTFYSQPKRTQDVLTAFKRTSVKPSSWPRSSPLVNLLLSNLLWS